MAFATLCELEEGVQRLNTPYHHTKDAEDDIDVFVVYLNTSCEPNRRTADDDWDIDCGTPSVILLVGDAVEDR